MAKKEWFIYKIRDINTGLFSTGGQYPTWNTKGKTWNTRGSLRSHLTHVAKGQWNSRLKQFSSVPIPMAWEIVQYAVTESSTFSAHDEANRKSKK